MLLRGAGEAVAGRFARMRAPVLALGIGKDLFGIVSVIARLLSYYTSSDWHHLWPASDALH